MMRHTGQTQVYLRSARAARILVITKRALHNWIKAGEYLVRKRIRETG
jgi:hypothetical protein